MAEAVPGSTVSDCSVADSNDCKVNVNTPAIVAWEGRHAELALHLQHDPSTSTAFLKLRTSLVLKALSPAKTHLYLFIPPERIQTLAFDCSPEPDSTPLYISKALGSSFICLRASLKSAADLIGPKSVGLKPKNQVEGRVLDELRSLARSTELAVLIPRHVISNEKVLHVCYGISDRLLRSDPGHLDLACLYEGRGGQKVAVGESDTPSRIAPGKAHQLCDDSPPSYDEAGPCPPAAPAPTALPAGKKRRLDSSGAVELSDDLLAAMSRMIREEVRAQVSKEMQKLEIRLNSKLDCIVDRHVERWTDELEGTRQEFDDKIEDDFFGVRMKLEDYIKEELTEAEQRIIEHLQDSASVRLEFGP